MILRASPRTERGTAVLSDSHLFEAALVRFATCSFDRTHCVNGVDGPATLSRRLVDIGCARAVDSALPIRLGIHVVGARSEATAYRLTSSF